MEECRLWSQHQGPRKKTLKTAWQHREVAARKGGLIFHVIRKSVFTSQPLFSRKLNAGVLSKCACTRVRRQTLEQHCARVHAHSASRYTASIYAKTNFTGEEQPYSVEIFTGTLFGELGGCIIGARSVHYKQGERGINEKGSDTRGERVTVNRLTARRMSAFCIVTLIL